MGCLLCGNSRGGDNSDSTEKEELGGAATCIIENEFAQNTTCHGMAFWCSSRYTIQRIFWICLVLGMTGAMTQQVASRIIAYYEFKSSTDISSEFVTSMPFPAVTICNFNRYFDPGSDAEETSMRALNRVASPAYLRFAESQGIGLDIADLAFFNSLNTNISTYMAAKGYPLRDRMELRSCRFAGRMCQSTDFTPVVTNSGKCYTFNSNVSEEKLQWVEGWGAGLSITLDVLHDKYTEEPFSGNQEAGIRFQVHDKHIPPNVEKYGIGVPIGRKGYALMSRKDTQVMYQPWGRCDPENEKTLSYFSNYSLHACVQECYTFEVVQNCSCRTFDQYWVTDVPECTPQQMAECTSPLLARLEQELTPESCFCSVPCNFKTYPVTMSYAHIPNINAEAYFQSNFNDTDSYLAENILALDISFEQLAYIKETQSKLIDESSLLSDLGGQLGLWVGMSLITIFEFIQYIVMRLGACVVIAGKKIKKRRIGSSRRMTNTNGHVVNTGAFER